MEVFNAEEVEHIAEREPICIVPNFSMGKMYLVAGDIGPFKPGLPMQVPLWVGLCLKRQVKCRILIPDWMDPGVLEMIKDAELKYETFTRMPSEHYFVIAKILFQYCAEDIPNINVLRTLIKDIWDIRSAKLRKSVKLFLGSDSSFAKVDHLTMMEMVSIRPFLTHSLEQIFRVKKTVSVAKNALARSQPHSQSTTASNSMSMSFSETQ